MLMNPQMMMMGAGGMASSSIKLKAMLALGVLAVGGVAAYFVYSSTATETGTAGDVAADAGGVVETGQTKLVETQAPTLQQQADRAASDMAAAKQAREDEEAASAEKARNLKIIEDKKEFDRQEAIRIAKKEKDDAIQRAKDKEASDLKSITTQYKEGEVLRCADGSHSGRIFKWLSGKARAFGDEWVYRTYNKPDYTNVSGCDKLPWGDNLPLAENTHIQCKGGQHAGKIAKVVNEKLRHFSEGVVYDHWGRPGTLDYNYCDREHWGSIMPMPPNTVVVCTGGQKGANAWAASLADGKLHHYPTPAIYKKHGSPKGPRLAASTCDGIGWGDNMT